MSIEVDPRIAHDTGRTVDTEVDRRLDKLGTDRAAALLGSAAIANARLAYQRYEQATSTGRRKSLEETGARPQRPLWASTGVKDPACHDTRYVTGLVAPGVVNTMPEATLNAVSDHGDVPDGSIRDTYDQSRPCSASSPPSASTTTTSCRSWKTRA